MQPTKVAVFAVMHANAGQWFDVCDVSLATGRKLKSVGPVLSTMAKEGVLLQRRNNNSKHKKNEYCMVSASKPVTATRNGYEVEGKTRNAHPRKAPVKQEAPLQRPANDIQIRVLEHTLSVGEARALFEALTRLFNAGV